MTQRFQHIFMIFFFAVCVSNTAFSQLRCGAMERWQMEVKNNPELRENRSLVEEKIKQWKKSTTSNAYTIPVVFHIIYENESENVSAAQIQSQLDVLNQDFNRTNPDANQTPLAFQNLAADCNINFCLAQRTPNNDTSQGITYTQSDISSFSLYDNRIFHDSLGGKTIWDPSKYLNIYVCDLTNALGFASFPGSNQSRDAVVINYSNFGTIDVQPPFNKGRTATHELGHWLNLLHIWGDGSCGNDLVEDTPIQEIENYGCPSHPSPTCSNNGDMFQNFMDYSNDACMNLFTDGQKDRMHATLNTQRANISNTVACSLPYEDVGINENISPANNQQYCGTEVQLTTSLYNYSNSTIYQSDVYFQIDDGEIQSTTWNGNLPPLSSVEINFGVFTLETGEHNLLIYSSSPNGFRDINPSNDTLSLSFILKDGTPFEFQIQTDNYAEENRWEILNDNNAIIASGNDLESNQFNTFSFCQDIDSCYTLVIYDEYNDGICCDFGNGYIVVNNQITSGEFNSEAVIDLCAVSDIDETIEKQQVTIFPNPSTDWITIQSDFIIKTISLYNILGRIVKEKNCYKDEEMLNLHDLKDGTYLIHINTINDYNYYQKIIKQ